MEHVTDGTGSSGWLVWDCGGSVNVIDLDLDPSYLSAVSIYTDHAGNGSGCNNWCFDALGRELDLEFCRSRRMYVDELRSAQALGFYVGEELRRDD